MRKSCFAAFATVVVTGGALVGTALPAQADAPTTLYVRQNLATGCSDQFPGTLAQPFCTISAAAAIVTGGQTVDIGGGVYMERVSVTSSGTPQQPIVFVGSSINASLGGASAGFVVDGQHDVVLQNIRVVGSGDVPAADVRNSSGITIRGGTYALHTPATSPVIRFAGVTGSSVSKTSVTGLTSTAGITVDAASSDVDIQGTTLQGYANYFLADDTVGVRIDGPGNSYVGGRIDGFTGAALALGPAAAGTVVANNVISGGGGHGVHNNGATGTAITNNTIRDRCRDGIRVDGASSGVSVQNNVLVTNGYFNQGYCEPAFLDGVEIGVYGGAVGKTVVDYNNAHHYYNDSPQIYAWNTRMGLAAFRAASGQAAHDRETGQARDDIDSANSAAPGYPTLDHAGSPRVDDLTVPNTGAGPVTYADRGTVETVRSPVVSFDVALNIQARSVSVNASASTPGLNPIASYRFSFGDDSVVTQSSPIASHTYANPGSYQVTVTVTGTDGRSDTRHTQISMLRPTGTVGLRALSNRRYVSYQTGFGLRPNQAEPSTIAQFDLADAGDGKVALFSRVVGRYVAISQFDHVTLTADSVLVDVREMFTLVRNGDGTISLQAPITTQFVTADPSGTLAMSASRPTIGTWEKFLQVVVPDANRSLKARVNGRFVSADGAGTKPLIASAATASSWERFDVVDLGNGQVGLLARVNNRFVSADGAGAKPLIANAPTASTWERFTMVRSSDGTVSFKAAVNNKYVSADGAGSKPLIAKGPVVSTWERFTIG
ncbi:PKD domain-containing protein [Micromonospora hortensis]|uniref:PKD domain-containing protein n=1 Tax=Micromonospora hortensis TaxID=2911209 RepID=UPI001EE7BEC9|nr:PKD domain-containing protein [Micromonospora hortensis]MCG5450884.1 PKD domain-containing protein [Micromonospora hortensis]